VLFLMYNGIVCGRGRTDVRRLCNAHMHYNPGRRRMMGIQPSPLVTVMTGVKSISAMGDVSIFLKENNDLYGCGENSDGQLGKTPYYRTYPHSSMYTNLATPNLISSNVKFAIAGRSGVIMELNNGSTFATGSDKCNEFGFETKYKSPETDKWQSERPIKLHVQDGLKASGTGIHKFWFIAPNGTLFAQGCNSKYGEMGVPNTSNMILENPPIRVMDNVQSVASEVHTLFLLKNGSLFGAGQNSWYGQLGDGSFTDQFSPIWIMNDVKAFTVSSRTSLVIKNDGAVYVCNKDKTQSEFKEMMVLT